MPETRKVGIQGLTPSVLVKPVPGREQFPEAPQAPKPEEVKVDAPGNLTAQATEVSPIPNPERIKYEKMWDFQQYRKVSPGEGLVEAFLSQARPPAGQRVLDFGAGTGRAAMKMAVLGQVKVTMIDFARNCLDPEVQQALTSQGDWFKFVLADLEKPIPVAAEYGFCTDVMEHIPEDKVSTVLFNIMKAAQHVFFAISTGPDNCGQLINETLHMTVKPAAWWSKQFRDLGAQVNWYREFDGGVVIYATAWTDAKELMVRGAINTPHETLIDQMKQNIRRGWPQLLTHDRQDRPALILAGGPSLNDYKDEIIQKREAGHSLICVNGTYKWAVDNGMSPSGMFMVDAREFNNRFLDPIVDNCFYFIASHCHPSTLDKVPKGRGILWHCVAGKDLIAPLDEFYGDGGWLFVPGGSTVVLRTICALRMLGVWRMELYGFDSCYRVDPADEEKFLHHAYSQPENDNQGVIKITCGGKIFYGSSWMVSQAYEFMDQVKFMADEVKLAVHGDGLIAHIIRTGATLPDKE